MNAPLVVTGTLHVPATTGRRRRSTTAAPTPEPPSGRVPRIARLLALAIKLDAQVRAGKVPDYAALARLGHVSRARISQIMNLLCLAPDIQEEILFLPPLRQGRDPLHIRQLQRIALTPEWPRQRSLWQQLRTAARR
jgi:hypothetical protein